MRSPRLLPSDRIARVMPSALSSWSPTRSANSCGDRRLRLVHGDRRPPDPGVGQADGEQPVGEGLDQVDRLAGDDRRPARRRVRRSARCRRRRRSAPPGRGRARGRRRRRSPARRARSKSYTPWWPRARRPVSVMRSVMPIPLCCAAGAGRWRPRRPGRRRCRGRRARGRPRRRRPRRAGWWRAVAPRARPAAGACRPRRRAAGRGRSCGWRAKSSGKPRSSSSGRRVLSCQLWSAVLAKPSPGSMIEPVGGDAGGERGVDPLAAVRRGPRRPRRRRRPARVIRREWPRQCISTQGQPASRTTRAMSGSASPPETSLTIVGAGGEGGLGDRGAGGVDAHRHAGGGEVADDRQHPGDLGGGVDPLGAGPGRLAADVDQVRAVGVQPRCRARPPASRSVYRPPSEKESGVTLRTPITTGKSARTRSVTA